MPISLLKRLEKGTPLTASEHDDNLISIEELVNSNETALENKVDDIGAQLAAATYVDNLPGAHDASTALLGNNTFGLLNPVQVSGGEITAGTETEIRSLSPADIISFIIQHGASGGLALSLDAATAITIGDGTAGTHRVLTSDDAVALTLDKDATPGAEVATTKAGAGAVTVDVEAGATYWVPEDDIGGSGATASFTVEGYVYFVCIRNTGGAAAEWLVVGQTSLASTISSALNVLGVLTLSSTLAMQDNLLTRPKLQDVSETHQAVTSSAGAATINLVNGNDVVIELTENITSLTISNPPASGAAGAFTLEIIQDATPRTITWPASITWPGGVEPTLSTGAGAVDQFVFRTRDGGTTWRGNIVGQAYA